MDPNEALRRVREHITHILNDDGDCDVTELAEAFDALDGWLTRGGFLPAAWEIGRTSRTD